MNKRKSLTTVAILSGTLLLGPSVLAQAQNTSTNDFTQALVNNTNSYGITMGNELVKVDKNNFKDWFDRDGDTATYDQDTGIVTYTQDKQQQAGGFLLKGQIYIDLGYDLKLKGKINLGDKNMHNGGADGIGFSFMPGKSRVGERGGGLGMGGIENAFGFGFDTYWNGEARPGYEPDPESMKDKTYGGFMYNQGADNTRRVYTGTDAPPQQIPDPTNNQFKDVTFEFNSKTRVMSVTYDGKTWSRNISDWLTPGVNAYGFSSTASTGNQHNLQQFQIEEMEFTALVTPTRPVDNEGKEIPHKGIEFPKVPGMPGEEIEIDPTDLPDVPGYNKPKDKFKVTLPEPGGIIDIPYEKVPETPSKPVDPNGKEIPTDKEFPKFPGNPGEEIEIDPTDLPEIPGFEKPKDKFKVTIPKEGEEIEIPYTPKEKNIETPSRPVDPQGKEIPHKGIEFPNFPGKPGEEIEIDPSEVPSIPGYNKPKDKFKVTIPKEGGIIDIPYTPRDKYTETPSVPVDPQGKEIPHTGIEFPKFPGKPGEEIEIDPSEVPSIPGYNKPKDKFKVTIPKEGEKIEIPYTPRDKNTETPSQPVDPQGNKITTDKEFPTFPGKPGEEIEIDPSEVPSIPGYNKPKDKFKVTIPKEGGIIDIPYTPRDKNTETPSQPVDPNGNKIPTDKEFPKFPGKPGEEITIDPTDLPEIPGYNKPKDKFKVTIPKDGSPIQIPYTPKEEAGKSQQPSNPSNSGTNNNNNGFRKVLPNTGEQATIWASVFGVIMLALAGLGLAKKQKGNQEK